jgi:hypothetical protein
MSGGCWGVFSDGRQGFCRQLIQRLGTRALPLQSLSRGEAVKDLIRLSAVLLLVSLSLSLSLSLAEAQDLREAHTYWSTSNITLIAADAVAKSADMAFTMRNSGLRDFQEHDPLARPFVHSGPVLAGAAQGLLFASEVFTSYELDKHGHHKMAKFILLMGAGGNAIGIATSTR